jgi:hypothetical protein
MRISGYPESLTSWKDRCLERGGKPLMQFEWDPKKAKSNDKKHGVSFEEADHQRVNCDRT